MTEEAKAKAYRAPVPRKRTVKLHKTATAAEALGPVAPGMEVFCLTFGQFSLIDAIEHLVREVGPCDVVVSTWTAAAADAERAEALLRDGNIRRFRLVVDRSFVARQRHYCERVTELFGPDAIRTTRTHAKFALITTSDYALVVRTSMNLNHNPRLEDIEVSDDPQLAAFFAGIVDELFAETAPGATVSMDMPVLAGTRVHDTPPPIEMGRIVATSGAHDERLGRAR